MLAYFFFSCPVFVFRDIRNSLGKNSFHIRDLLDKTLFITSAGWRGGAGNGERGKEEGRGEWERGDRKKSELSDLS